MSRQDPTLSKLNDLLVGSTVEAIEPPEPGVHEAMCKFTVAKGAVKHEFHLHATDMGWWIGEHQIIRPLAGGETLRQYADFEQLVEAVSDHLVSPELDDRDFDVSPLESYDDPLLRSFGFRCKMTNKEWEFSMATLRAVEAPHIREALTTPEGRAKIASLLGLLMRLPMAEEL